jgi:hypothetical protein
MEDMFIIPQVRFIALGEGVDTVDGVDYLVDLIHAMNGLYPKQVSRKVRQVKKDGAEQGWFMNSQESYGYIKSPLDRHILLPDEYAAAIVRRIFEEFNMGFSGREIADRLNSECVVSPRAYHYAQMGKENPYPSQKNCWCSGTVMSLLRKQVYIGDMISGKREVASIKTKRVRATDPSDWIIVHGTHEPIVERGAWELAQRRIAENKRVYNTKKTGAPGLFASLLVCEDCGSRLAYSTSKLGYRCSSYINAGSCSTHYINEDDLMTFVMGDIKRYAALSGKSKTRLINRLLASLRKEQTHSTNELVTQIKKAESRLDTISSTLTSLYVDKATGVLPERVFLNMMESFIKEQGELEERLPRLRQELGVASASEAEIEHWLSLIESCVDLERIDREIILGLVEKIVVGERVKAAGKTTQTLQIYYRFIGNILWTPKRASLCSNALRTFSF